MSKIKLKDWKGVAVVIEQDEGNAEDISWELLGKGRELADKAKEDLIAIVFGHNIDHIAEEAIHRGADKVVKADHELLDHYKWEVYTKVGYELINDLKPSSLIFGATPNGRDLAGRLAVKLDTGLTADVVELDIGEPNLLLGSVPGFGGSILAVIKCEHARPQIATVRPGIFTAIEPDTSKKGKIKEFKVKLSDSDVTTKLVRKIKIDAEDISKAKRLVAAGRGVGDNLDLAKELAELLDGKIGVTRPLCDQGLLPRNYQIGSTGVTVKSDLTIVLGASGAMHFTSGIDDSETVIAINIDETAQIFEHADYSVVGDINEILPLLVEKLKAKLLQKEAH